MMFSSKSPRVGSRSTRWRRRLAFLALTATGFLPAVGSAATPVFHLDFSQLQDQSPNKLRIAVGESVKLVPNGGPLLTGGKQLNAGLWQGTEDDTNQILIFDSPLLDAVARGAGTILTWIKPVDGDEWNNIAKTPCEENLEPCDAFSQFRGIEFQASGPHAGVFGAVQGWETNNFSPLAPSPFGGGDGSSDTPSGVWTHAALVWNAAGDHTIYVNGEPGVTVEGVGADEFGLNTPDFWTIGGDGLTTAPANADPLRYLNGQLADFAIFNAALTQSEIQQIMRDGISAPSLPGDFDANGSLQEVDVNLLMAAMASGANNKSFDLTADNLVNASDLNRWVKELKKTWIGDANLDLVFGSSDFVTVFQAGKFEVDVSATWGEGDWNGDLRFNTTDFIAAFQDGGFEAGPRPAQVASVPEPWMSGWVSMTLLLATLRSFRKSK